MNKILMPALFFILVILIIRGVTLEGAGKGILFYLKPDFSKFTVEAALAAVGQSFFSLGVGLGCALVFGSYMRKEDKIVSNAALIGISDTFAAFLGGFLIFPLVFVFGLQPGAGVGLTFITMPNVFNRMPMGNFFGAMFYLLFFLAAFTSFLGGTESIVTHLRDKWNIPRKTGTLLTAGIVMMIAVAASASTKIFAKVDYIAINICLMLASLLMTVFVGRVWPLREFLKVAEIEKKPAQVFWAIVIKYFAPIAILVIWLSQLGVLKY
jgi:NSS family neurotransmitter:Na+ symporter